MFRTTLWYIFFWLYLILSPLFFIPFAGIAVTGKRKLLDRYVLLLSTVWGRVLIRAAGGTVTVTGLEHIPQQNRVCFIANHQGGFDIPLIFGYIPRITGFIAKKELLFIPILNIWMKVYHCIFINRSNRRDSVKAIRRGVEQIKKGRPMVIFPEGTRSQCRRMGPFKSGSLKLAIRSNAAIVPITIDGSYKLKEANGGIMKPASVKLIIHPSLDGTFYKDENSQELAEKLWHIINAPLTGAAR